MNYTTKGGFPLNGNNSHQSPAYNRQKQLLTASWSGLQQEWCPWEQIHGFSPAPSTNVLRDLVTARARLFMFPKGFEIHR